MAEPDLAFSLVQTPDPLASARKRFKRALWLSVAAISAVSIWAARPLAFSKTLTGEIDSSKNKDENTTLQGETPAKVLDQSAFAVALWVAPPPPSEPVKEVVQPPPPPPPPLKLQLVGIRNGADGLKAVLFDPEGSRVWTAAEGERVQRYSIKALDAETVVLEHTEFPGKATHTLKMKAKVSLVPGSGGTGGSR